MGDARTTIISMDFVTRFKNIHFAPLSEHVTWFTIRSHLLFFCHANNLYR